METQTQTQTETPTVPLTLEEERSEARDKMSELAAMISDPLFEEAARTGDYSVLGILRQKMPSELQDTCVQFYKTELGLAVEDDDDCRKALDRLQEISGTSSSIDEVRKILDSPDGEDISYDVTEVVKLYTLAVDFPLYKETVKDVLLHIGEIMEDQFIVSFAQRASEQSAGLMVKTSST